jgi:hypothetical protein
MIAPQDKSSLKAKRVKSIIWPILTLVTQPIVIEDDDDIKEQSGVNDVMDRVRGNLDGKVGQTI